jgi:hypothetical protein
MRTTKILLAAAALAVGLTAVVASSADAAPARKKKQHYGKPAHASMKVRHRAPAARAGYWGTDQVRAGPLYNGPDYLGDDPDPNIRAHLLKDLTGRYGGID